MYYPHNIHFLWSASSMEGRSAVAIEAARKVAANVRLEQIKEFPTVEFFKTIPLVGLVQFGRQVRRELPVYQERQRRPS